LTEAPLFGRTVNPWNTGRTVGGSSGGAGAAAAAGYGPLHVGTDGGGSIRIPSACCGIVGMKATLGLVPHDQAPEAFANLSYIGPMTRSVADAALMLDVMAGPHAADPHSLGRETPDLGAAVASADIQASGSAGGHGSATRRSIPRRSGSSRPRSAPSRAWVPAWNGARATSPARCRSGHR
jgi:aspartyl-tRNA(Asn)/glutamyl-tRNA(Gln) amidotransferase subunit A